MSAIVAFTIPGAGHLQCLLPAVHGLAARGPEVHVFGHRDQRSAIERAGGRFVDLFGRYPLDAADATSTPIPSRYVTFAGVYAERIADDVAALEPGLVVHETFSVVAHVVARRLALPYVNVFANHVESANVVAVHDDSRVATSAACLAAVERLEAVHGMRAASPFSYADGFSPFLNLYPEPAEFLGDHLRDAVQPLVCLGSLTPELRDAGAAPVFAPRRGRARLFASFGTVVWSYFRPQALAALAAIAAAGEELGLDVLVSLGGVELTAAERVRLERPNVRVAGYVDQWTALREADVFATHHGVNSTHEAIYHQVPMLSCPFFGDQPALAARCRQLGLAVAPQAAAPADLTAGAVRRALTRIEEGREGLAARLAEARAWELRTLEARDATIDRVLALAAPPVRASSRPARARKQRAPA